MTLTIVATTPKGIVLGADSRCSHKIEPSIKKEAKFKLDDYYFNDNYTKIFPLTHYIACTIAGSIQWTDPTSSKKDVNIDVLETTRGFEVKKTDEQSISEVTRSFAEYLEEQYKIEAQLAKLKQDFEETLKKGCEEEGCEVKEIELLGGPYNVKSLYESFYPPGLLAHVVKKDGEKSRVYFPLPQSDFLIAGYHGEKDSIPKVFQVTVPPGDCFELTGDSSLVDSPKNTNRYGIHYSGDKRVVDWLTRYRYYRLTDVLYGVKFKSWPGLEDIDGKKLETLFKKIRPKGNDINWTEVDLENATSIVASMIEATKILQKDFDKICFDKKCENPNSVGGLPDIATITPEAGFQWHTKKGVRQKG